MNLNSFFSELIHLISRFCTSADEFGRSENFIEHISWAVKMLYDHYFRVTAIGAKHLKIKGPFIIAANHSGTLPYDAAMLAHAVKIYSKKDLRFLADKFVYQIPVLKELLRLSGAMPASFDNALSLLKAKHPVLIFPEGVRGIGKPYSRRYRLNRFRTGFARLAKELKIPVIPVGVVGAEEIHPIIHREEKLAKIVGLPFIPITPTFPWLGPLGLLPLPTKWIISFGKPISPNKPLSEIVSTTRDQIAKLIREGRDKRTTIWE